MWMEGAELMISGKAAAYAGGAAVAGGLARWLADGDYRMVSLVQKLTGGAVGWCFVVAFSVVFPAITENIWAFGALCFLSAYLVEPLLKIIFWRIEHADVSLNVGAAKVQSDGKENEK